MADFPAKPMSLQKAIKEALAPYDRKFISNLVADAAFQAIDISLQRNYDYPKRFQFLKWAENHKPAIPKSLLNVPVPEMEESFRPAICKNCKNNFLLRINYWLYVQESMNQYSRRIQTYSLIEENNNLQSQRQHFADQQSSIADQQISPLQVLFGFMKEN